MCPNHAEHALRRRHNRFRKERIVDLTNAPDDARNSGVIDVIDDEPPVELADPKVKFRVPATLIRRQFELRVQRDRQQRSGQISPGTGSPLTDDSSPVIDGKANGTTEPSPGARQSNGLESGPVALAEWLQSIVSFQQDVAQFVMATHNITQDASSPGTGRVDKMQMLTDIAASVLNPPAALPAAQSNRAAPKSDQATTPNASVAASRLNQVIPGYVGSLYSTACRDRTCSRHWMRS
ncbi:hypothetical protein DL89DRAFT_122769 [Linderina pennispora]|uniref:Uncharacterized protein n=1 Tax=Linderina pennispora TaxID=61395 RepID=A0A1Y1WCK5_9FUNG|nr:uncharacterized protein DL89DRAFT_122769 [Linderina pennispora]ORX71270.1 hypothetical protein DL89DRAFT_122769 [Linderina pennispora]